MVTIKHALRAVATTALEVVGAFSVLYGIAQFCVPAAFIVAGLSIAGLGYLLS